MDYSLEFPHIFKTKCIIKLDRVKTEIQTDEKPTPTSPDRRTTRSKAKKILCEWVKVRSGYYKGDLAYLESIEDDTAIISILPRINYTTLESESNSNSKLRPTAKPFDANEIKKSGGKPEFKSNFWFWNEEKFSSGGLHQKSILLKDIEMEGVMPTATAMKRINDCKKSISSVQTSTTTTSTVLKKRKREEEPALRLNSDDLIVVTPSKRSRREGRKISKRKKKKRAPARGLQLQSITPPDLSRFSIVWVKVRGYKDWPGVIENEVDGSFHIHFFGDYTTQIVKQNRITNFYEGFILFQSTFDDVKLKKAVQEACLCMMDQSKPKHPNECAVCEIVNRNKNTTDE